MLGDPDVHANARVDVRINAVLRKSGGLPRPREARRTSRAGRLHTQAIETDRFPTATFKATGPFAIPDKARKGTDFTVPVTGDLTLHGVTRGVTVKIQGRASGDTVELVGSYTFPLSDFKIDKPSSPFVVSIEDNGTLEFKMEFGRQ
jgi:polyisoprenoid-binding protein YceI